jgi:hypothetical protein
MLSFETLLCILAVVRAVQMYQPSRSLFHSGRQLVAVLVRDSLMYFLVLVLSSFPLLILGLTPILQNLRHISYLLARVDSGTCKCPFSNLKS